MHTQDLAAVHSSHAEKKEVVSQNEASIGQVVRKGIYTVYTQQSCLSGIHPSSSVLGAKGAVKVVAKLCHSVSSENASKKLSAQDRGLSHYFQTTVSGSKLAQKGGGVDAILLAHC